VAALSMAINLPPSNCHRSDARDVEQTFATAPHGIQIFYRDNKLMADSFERSPECHSILADRLLRESGRFYCAASNRIA
jgi:hypothetical protein